MLKLNKEFLIVALITLAFFVMPFFWFKPGELDLGGDSSRLYFYNPRDYLKSTALFSVDPVGTAKILSAQFYAPFLILLTMLNSIFRSPSVLALLEKSFKLSLSFFFVFLIVRNMLSTTLKKPSISVLGGAILAGIFYALSPAMTGNFLNALLIHNEMFLNPLIFYLLLRYCQSRKSPYLWFATLVAVIFAPNFSLGAPPPVFSFYPLTLLFLFLYVTRVNHIKFPWRQLFIWGLLTAGLNAFHLVPVIANVFNPDSFLHARAFEVSLQETGLEYFNGVLVLGKVSTSLFLPGISKFFYEIAIIPIAIIVTGFSITKRKNAVILTGIFFLLALFLESANITHLGVSFYRMLFKIPGFGMFRNFSGQWQFVYVFFYAILFGFMAESILTKLKSRYALIVILTISLLLIVRDYDFISGQTVNAELPFAKGTKATIVIDDIYDETLSFIKSLPPDGKILSLPLTDFFYQVFHGRNNGAYIGPSSISYLAGKNDFSGYQEFYPFPEVFMRLSREKDYSNILKLLAALNIRYIFYNSDPRIYDSFFPSRPYDYMRTSLPKTQAEYAEYIKNLGGRIIYENGPYKIFDLETSSFAPIVSVPRILYQYQNNRDDWYGQNESFFTDHPESPPEAAYVLKETCLKIFSASFCGNQSGAIDHVPTPLVEKINPTKYKISLENSGSPFILILANSYDSSWRIYLDNRTKDRRPNDLISIITRQLFQDSDIFETRHLNQIAGLRHFTINGYANAWLVKPTDLNPRENKLIIETQAQQIFYQSAVVSIAVSIIFVLWGIFLLYSGFGEKFTWIR